MDMEITTIMKHTIILFQSQELLLTINHIIIKVNQVIYILSIIQETARSKRKMHIFTYHIKVSIYTIIESVLDFDYRNIHLPYPMQNAE